VRRSDGRILTTHVGSLPRPEPLLEALREYQVGDLSDEEWRAQVDEAVAEAIRKQVERGIDVVADGELGKPSFLTYVDERLSGFERAPATERDGPWSGSREEQSFPEYYAWQARTTASPALAARRRVCRGPIEYVGYDELQADLDTLRAALAGVEVAEAFVPAISPSNVANWHLNEYYDSEDDYLEALADALHEEYRTIIEAGFLLQVDDPALVTHYALTPGSSVRDCRAWAAVRVDVLNQALEGLPPDRIRFHTCYSINMGPRVHDMELRDIVDLMLRVEAGAYSFEAANPRHEHEWQVWADVKLPDDKLLIPGVITHSSVLVEHPELVAQRIERFASVVGPERVIAGADCGFATFAGSQEIHGSIAWAKLEALGQGARIASERLFR